MRIVHIPGTGEIIIWQAEVQFPIRQEIIKKSFFLKTLKGEIVNTELMFHIVIQEGGL
jgi:hypothetical protein